ncbi:hypothetical protein D3C84_529300 [compost metagenome]
MGNDDTAAAEQERVACAVEIQGIDRVSHCLQADIATEGAPERPCLADPSHCGYQYFTRPGYRVGFGQYRPGSVTRLGIPGPLAGVPVGRRFPARIVAEGSSASCLQPAEHGEKLLHEHGRSENLFYLRVTEITVYLLRCHVDQLQLGVQPGLDLARQCRARFVDAGFDLLTQGRAHLADLGQRQQAGGEQQNQRCGYRHLGAYPHRA